MSENITDWMLNSIRDEAEKFASIGGWLELERFEWTGIVNRIIFHMLNGGSLLVCADNDRQWFVKYIISNINKLGGRSRPIIPVFELKNFIGNDNFFKDTSLINDALDIAYKDYAFWYIGKSNTEFSNLSFSKENSFLWVLDESIQNGLKLSSNDAMLDYKLIQLFKIFEKALFGTIFGKINLE